MNVIAVLNDLIFETKIRSTAQSLGVVLSVVRSTDSVPAELDQVRPGLVIVDLNAAGSEPIEAVVAAKSHACQPWVVAYVSHVDADLAARAEKPGPTKSSPGHGSLVNFRESSQRMLDRVDGRCQETVFSRPVVSQPRPG